MYDPTKLSQMWQEKLIIGTILSIFSPFKVSLFILITLIIFDTITGTAYAVRIKRFSSKGFKKSLFKLMTYFGAITTVRLLEIGIQDYIGTTSAATNLITSYLILAEGISVLENLTLLGVPIPSGFIKVLLKNLKNKSFDSFFDGDNQVSKYLSEIDDMINYQIPGIKSTNMQKLLEIEFEECKNLILITDMQLSNTSIDSNDLIYYKLQSIINSSRDTIKKKVKELNIPAECIENFNEWLNNHMNQWSISLKETCYSNNPLEKKKKDIIEATMVLLYHTLGDVQKGETCSLNENNNAPNC